ncbi:hypothetical protein [Okeania sp. SIO3B5]|nr:hypothetical protein [Okeania sp. SIO3B5]
MAEGRRKKEEGRRKKAEGRRQKAEGKKKFVIGNIFFLGYSNSPLDL